MGEKLTKDLLTPVEDSPGRSSGQQDTHDVISIDRISATNGARPLDPASEEYKLMEKKLVRKIDLRLMPITILLYILNYLGK